MRQIGAAFGRRGRLDSKVISEPPSTFNCAEREAAHKVTLRGHRSGNNVHIEIINPLPTTPPTGGNGHGLDSVRRRIAYRYGAQAVVRASPQGERFVVVLQLPGQPS